MGQFVFQTDERSEVFCLEIARAMIVFFGISQSDAILRINEHWKHLTFTGDDIMYSQPVDYWAKWMFHGNGAWGNSNLLVEASLSRIERKINKILEHLGIGDMPISDHVRFLLEQGNKLGAIQIYRAESGLDLRGTQAVIDRILAEMQQTLPNVPE